MNVGQRTLTPLLARTQRFSASAGDGKDDKPKVVNHADVPIVDYEDPDYLPLPEYPFKPDEPLETKKQRYLRWITL